MPPLAVAPFPVVGEHFGSWIRRLASYNGFDTVGALTTHLGLITLSPVSSERTWARLEEASGIGRAQLDQLRMLSSSKKRHKLAMIDGNLHQYGFLDRVHLRSCPSCIAEDGHLPMRFAMRHVTACLRHGLRLDDACACGRPRRIFDRKSLWRCPACGLDAAEQPRTKADPHELLIAAVLLDPASCHYRTVPQALLDESRTAKAAVVERLGTLAQLERNDSPSGSCHNIGKRNVEAADRTRRLVNDREVVLAAVDVLSDWPDGYIALLRRLVDRHGNPDAATALLRRFSSRAGRLALRSFVDHDRRVVPFAEEARLAALRDAVGYVPDSELVMRPSGHFERMPCTPSANVSGPRNDAGFVSAFEFGTRLHVGDRFRINAWFEAELIGTVRHDDGAVLVRRTDFDHLLARVASLPNGNGDDADYLPSIILNNKRGAFYRQRFLLEDVMSGAIRSRAAEDGTEGMAGRRLHRLDLAWMRMLCKTALQVIADDFVGVPSYLTVLWGIPAPSRQAIKMLRDEGRVRTRTAKAIYRDLVSVRDLIGVVQEDGERRIYDIAAAKKEAISADDWRAIVVDDLCAGRRRR